MARPLRIEFPGAIYHITSRGNARRKVFLDDEDKRCFLSTLAWVVERFGWICHAYCLMDNHFHLMIETTHPNLSRGMRQLNGVYTQRFNRRHRKVGHLFQGRFKAILVERDSYLLELCRYVVLNPVRTKMVKSPQDYVWSSYRATLGLESSPSGLSTDWLLGQFAKTKPAARRRYASFVLAGVGQSSPWEELKGQVLLGSESFVENHSLTLDSSARVQEITKGQRLLRRPSVKKLLGNSKSRKERNLAMAKAHLEYGYTLAEIGKAAELHYATVSRIIKSLEETS
jgi:putative transposase